MRVDGAAGPLALGAKGSACDRLTPYRRVEGSRPRELYSIAALARYGAFGAIIYVYAACGAEGHMASIEPPALGAKGCVERLHPTGETTHYDLCVAGAPANHVRCASLRSRGRRLAVRKTIEYQIGALLRTPFPAAREFPSRGNERYEEKNRESYTSCTTPAIPLWWLAPPPCPVGSVSLDSQSPTAPCESCDTLSRGEVRRSRIGGGERSEPITRMLIMPYDTESISRNADFISIALRAIHNPRPEGPSNLRTLRPSGRSILRTFLHNPSTQPAAIRRP